MAKEIKGTNFWRNPINDRTTNTGINANVNRDYRAKYKNENMQEYCDNIVNSIKNQYIPFTEDEKTAYSKCRKQQGKEFRAVVLDCVRNAKVSFGRVFGKEQLVDVLRILGYENVEVKMNQYDNFVVSVLN